MKFNEKNWKILRDKGANFSMTQFLDSVVDCLNELRDIAEILDDR